MATDETDRMQRRGLSARIARIGVKLGFALGVIAAVALGVGALNQRAGAGVSAQPADPLAVLTLTLQESAGYAEARRFAGRIEPARAAALGFERGGLLAEVSVAEGDQIAAGQIIARLDTATLGNTHLRLAAMRDQQAARLELARLTFDRQQGMTDRATSGQRRDEVRLALAEAEAALAETEASLQGVAIDLAKSEIRAPFAGMIAARLADEGAVLDTGAPVVRLLETGRPRARIGLSPQAAEGVVPGKLIVIRHQGASHPARLAALRPDLDADSRTVTALFDLEGAPAIPFGEPVSFEAETWVAAPGFWLPLTALVEGGRGLWTVYAITGGEGASSVAREAVAVVAVRGDMAFVQGGLRPGMRVVRDGAHRIRPGQQVRISG